MSHILRRANGLSCDPTTCPNGFELMSAIIFDAATAEAASVLARMSLQEDLRDVGDLTSLATIPAELEAEVRIVSRQQGVVCGLVLLPLTFHELPGVVTWTMHFQDGQPLERGAVLASVRGPVRTLLTGERTLLNFLTHLSGIATRTAEFVAQVQGTRAVVLDTRKTLPGYRLLQKYAVRCGGGTNHRMGLYDGILIKDNHLAARGESSCATAVADARQFMASRDASAAIEIEVDSLAQLRDALKAGPDIVLLDNMALTMLNEAVQIRDSMSPATQLEASGGVTLETIREIAKTGVDRISVGSLTHSSPSLDLGFDWPW
jgi:nicotinate-nucleotide pyrophosphorylase (carboxylating)